MRSFEIVTRIKEYASAEELPEADRLLLDAAREASMHAYAPYSDFYVGAAVRLKNPEGDPIIVKGSNQENVAYPSGLCAERVAMFAAGANYPGKAPETIAIVCRAKNFDVDKPLSPCGACRQSMAEYELHYKQPIRVLLAGESGAVQEIASISDLLPLIFVADELKRK